MERIGQATAADIPALMRIERQEGFETLVGRWDAEAHRAEMAKPGSRYLVSRRADGSIDGFVLLQGLDDPLLCATLRRIAVAQPGAGLGRALLAAAIAHAFTRTATHRLQLRVFPENTRARRAYARAGFSEEGLLRDVHRTPDGRFRSMILMSLLRPDVAAQQATGQ